jgi:hypothetical protein
LIFNVIFLRLRGDFRSQSDYFAEEAHGICALAQCIVTSDAVLSERLAEDLAWSLAKIGRMQKMFTCMLRPVLAATVSIRLLWNHYEHRQ